MISAQCQQHQRYEGQFRALFVVNCKIVKSSRLRMPVQSGADVGGEIYRPVACDRCETEVGVIDETGVYHFCNVLY